MKLATVVLCLFLSTMSSHSQNSGRESEAIDQVLNSWHKAASEANFENYFNLMTENAIFIGTDATENWNKKEFQAYAKPHFDKGKAWNFTTLERNIYFSVDKKTAWFDELLDTQMKICRGSGILIKENKQWKIAHYVLSMTIPNAVSEEVIKIKTPIEDVLLLEIKE